MTGVSQGPREVCRCARSAIVLAAHRAGTDIGVPAAGVAGAVAGLVARPAGRGATFEHFLPNQPTEIRHRRFRTAAHDTAIRHDDAAAARAPGRPTG
jgi:hypothetical protein